MCPICRKRPTTHPVRITFVHRDIAKSGQPECTGETQTLPICERCGVDFLLYMRQKLHERNLLDG